MKKVLTALVLALSLASIHAQDHASDTPALTARFTALLHSLDNGHSPSADDIIAAGDQPQPAKGDLHQAIPLIDKALSSSDKDVRQYTLTVLLGLEVTPQAPEALGAAAAKQAAATVAPPLQPSAFKADVARELNAEIPRIASKLADETEPNRLLAANVLGGFTPNPPAIDYIALAAFLTRDDAIGAVGQAVVEAILNLGPVPEMAATAITRYLRRSDQTSDTRANLIESIAGRPNQSAAINKTLLLYLDSDDPRVRARLILSLPQLDLTPDIFADTRARVSALAANEQENLQVVNAAKAVTVCWDAPHMTTPCPAY